MKSREPRHHSMPMTCKDKLDRVFSGEIRQTIRWGEKYQKGDTLTIFEWTGKPYRSKWGRRIEVLVKSIELIEIRNSGIGIIGAYAEVPWSDCYADHLAKNDGLEPPTGQHLKEVLFALHPTRHFQIGEIFQVVRW